VPPLPVVIVLLCTDRKLIGRASASS